MAKAPARSASTPSGNLFFAEIAERPFQRLGLRLYLRDAGDLLARLGIGSQQAPGAVPQRILRAEMLERIGGKVGGVRQHVRRSKALRIDVVAIGAAELEVFGDSHFLGTDAAFTIEAGRHVLFCRFPEIEQVGQTRRAVAQPVEIFVRMTGIDQPHRIASGKEGRVVAFLRKRRARRGLVVRP